MTAVRFTPIGRPFAASLKDQVVASRLVQFKRHFAADKGGAVNTPSGVERSYREGLASVVDIEEGQHSFDSHAILHQDN